MNQTTACSREELIQKLKQMHFYGPIMICGREFMLYHGQALAIPPDTHFSKAQFRFLLREVENIVSQEEWTF